ncbi:MAG: DUF1552 domain-containing protein [Acidobacteriota bacterium]
MINSKKKLPRRTVLRGVGAAVALPFLDAMVPAGTAWARPGATRDAAQAEDPARLLCIEMVHGAAGSNDWGATQNYWSPAATGRDFDLSPTALSSLEPYRDRLTIVSNTDCQQAEALEADEIGGDHYRSSAVFLTQSHPRQTQGSDVLAGTSLDQLYAARYGQETSVPSMQLCIENVDQAGGCDYGYACVYSDTVSWLSPTEPLPMIRDPRAVFDRLFGVGGTPEQRAARAASRRSVLDWIVDEVAHLQREVGAEDRLRLDRYLTNVRELERRIQKVVERNSSGEARALPEAPAGVPDSFGEHVRLMFDLQVLAFASDVTRVFSFKLGRDASARVYPESGIDKGFHPLSHHGDKHEVIEEFAELNRYHVSHVPYLLERLEEVTEGDQTLLDKTVVLYGSPMGDPNLHNHRRCPLFLAGGGNGALDGGVHLKADDGTPMANVMLDLLHRLGLEDLDQFGDSNGTVSLAAG